MPGRVRAGQRPCAARWPLTGNPCKNPARADHDTCAAHDPAGDQRGDPPPDQGRCAATNKESGERCRNKPLVDLTVCRLHGGGAPHTRKAAERRGVERQLRVAAATYGLPVDTTPEQAILEEIHRSAGIVAWLEREIRALSSDELTWGKVREKTGGDDWGTTDEARPHVLLTLYREERRHLVHVCATALRAGVEERRVRLAEQQGSLLVQVIRAILTDLRLTDEQQARVPQIVPRHLRAVAS